MNLKTHPFDWKRACVAVGLSYKQRSTGVFVALCPFHNEKTPSLHMWPMSGNFKCHGCGIGGNPLEFFALLTGGRKGDLEIDLSRFTSVRETPGQTDLDLLY